MKKFKLTPVSEIPGSLNQRYAVDSLGLKYTHSAHTAMSIKGDLVVAVRSITREIFIVAASKEPATERDIGHRGPFPTLEAALTYLQLVKD